MKPRWALNNRSREVFLRKKLGPARTFTGSSALTVADTAAVQA